jgi:opacity protein-like surface antigen
MRKIVFATLVLLLFAGLASAQIPTKGNVFFGYSYYNTDLSSIDRANTNGWEASVEGKVLPFIGIVADFDSHYGSQNFPEACAQPVSGAFTSCGNFNASVTEHNYLFGPRVSMSVGRFRPFAEALFGAAHVNAGAAGSDTSFAYALGGGLDYRLIKPIAWRFQGDYVSTQFFGTNQDNVRISTGLVLRF